MRKIFYIVIVIVIVWTVLAYIVSCFIQFLSLL
jgi:hypothetical protein